MRQTELESLLQQFLSKPWGKDTSVFRELVGHLQRSVREGSQELAAGALRRAAVVGLDYTSLTALARVYRHLRQNGALTQAQIRIAVLGGVTTELLTAFLELYLYAGGVVSDVYQGDYAVFRQEILDSASVLHRHKADIIFLAPTWHDLSCRPGPGDSREKVQEAVETEANAWVTLWHQAHKALQCQIIQDNFAPPAWRILGNHEMRHAAGLGRFICEVNLTLQDRAPAFVTLHDVDHLAASAGRWRWADPRFYHQAKLPCAPEYLGDYAHSVASVVLALLGAGRKCLVLDLDNTLWGGTIGDDGLGGIVLGHSTPEGEAFLAFQRYVKALAQRGVLLAVCSRNAPDMAAEAFRAHPEMVLRPDDISCFVANWQDKAGNLRAIAGALNIGLDALVFVDDDPVERGLVRKLLPQVAVPELPDDPADRIRSVEAGRYFQIVHLGGEDLQRADYYRANIQRDVASRSVESLAEYLRSLQMVARIETIEDTNVHRCAQLISRSNQFNLTGRKYTPAQVGALARDDSWIALAVWLSDRFGDNGLVSAVLAEICESQLRIDTWVMSCRVLQRGLEAFVLNHLCGLARRHDLTEVVGRYAPTGRNGLVREHYTRLGFACVARRDNGESLWQLMLGHSWRPRQTFIGEVPTDG